MTGGWLAFLLFATPATPTPTPASSLDAPVRPVATATPAAAGTPAPKRIAVVVAGEDAGAAGDLQRELEKRLPVAVPGLQVRPAADVTNRVGVARPAATPIEIPPETAAVFEQAVSAYYQAQYVRALDLFAKVQGLYANTDVPPSKRTEVFLWRVAVYLSLNDQVQAQTEALAALALNPELKVDPKSEIPPSVQAQIDRTKATSGFRLVTVIVNGLPPTATLAVDGRLVASRFKVTVGRHVVTATSSGRRAVTREIDVNADTAISLSLPVALETDDAEAVAAFAAGGDETPAIASLASKLDADWVLFAVTGAETRAVLRRSSTAALYRTEPAPVGAAPPTLIEVFQPRLAESLDEKDPATTTTFTPREGWSIRADGTVVASGWSRSLSGGETFETFFGGAGPELRIEAAKDSWLLSGAASWVSYDSSKVDVRLPDGTRTTATGGSTGRFLIGGGWRGLGPERELLRAVLALDVESHSSKDAANRGAKLNLLPSYTRAAVELRAGSRFVAPGLPDWRVDVEVGIAPYTYYAESPEGASGNSPAPGLGYLWSAALETGASRRWGYRLGYAGEMRSVAFKGEADAAVNPPMRDAELSEMVHALSLSLTRRF